MPRSPSAKSLQELCTKTVAANLRSTNWERLFTSSRWGYSRWSLGENPFEMLSNNIDHLFSHFQFKILFSVLQLHKS